MLCIWGCLLLDQPCGRTRSFISKIGSALLQPGRALTPSLQPFKLHSISVGTASSSDSQRTGLQVTHTSYDQQSACKMTWTRQLPGLCCRICSTSICPSIAELSSVSQLCLIICLRTCNPFGALSLSFSHICVQMWLSGFAAPKPSNATASFRQSAQSRLRP